MGTKICSRCNIEKEILEFGNDKRNNDGYRSECKKCHNIDNSIYRRNNHKKVLESQKRCYYKDHEKSKQRAKIYYLENKENRKEYIDKNRKLIYERQKKWKKENNQKVLEYSRKSYRKNIDHKKEYISKNREEINKRNTKWRKNNIEKVKKLGQKYRETHADYIKKYNNQNKEKINCQRRIIRNKRLMNDPLYKLTKNIRCRILVFLRQRGVTKRNKTFEIVGCTPQELRNHIESQFIEEMTWNNYGLYGWHIDHKIPLDNGKTEDEIYKLCHYSNLQPMWANENLKKSNKII